MRRLNKLNRLIAQIIETKGNLSGFDLVMIVVVTLTIVGLDEKPVMFSIFIKRKLCLAGYI
jgi:hypothetical protein